MRILIAEDEVELAKGLKFLLRRTSFPLILSITERMHWTTFTARITM